MVILVVSAMAQEELASQLRDACSKTTIIHVLAVERKYSRSGSMYANLERVCPDRAGAFGASDPADVDLLFAQRQLLSNPGNLDRRSFSPVRLGVILGLYLRGRLKPGPELAAGGVAASNEGQASRLAATSPALGLLASRSLASSAQALLAIA